MNYDGDYPWDWDEIARGVRARDGWACTECGDSGVELHVHHIVPISMGGGHEDSNLTTLCKECHMDEHPHMRFGGGGFETRVEAGWTPAVRLPSVRRNSIGRPKDGDTVTHNGHFYKFSGGGWRVNGLLASTAVQQEVQRKFREEHPELNQVPKRAVGSVRSTPPWREPKPASRSIDWVGLLERIPGWLYVVGAVFLLSRC